MLLKERLAEDMKQAMKDKEAGKLRLSVIRMVRASIKNIEIDRKVELDESGVLDVLAKEVKMRRDSLEEFQKANRADLVENLEREIEVLMAYLPKQLTEAEVRALVVEAVAVTGAAGPKDMGKVIGLVRPQVAGRADMGEVSKLVKAKLSGN